MFLVLAFIFTASMTIKSLVLEKELRLKEVLRAVGVQNGALWSSRFTENIVLLMVPCLLITVMVKVSKKKKSPWMDIKTQSICIGIFFMVANDKSLCTVHFKCFRPGRRMLQKTDYS